MLADSTSPSRMHQINSGGLLIIYGEEQYVSYLLFLEVLNHTLLSNLCKLCSSPKCHAPSENGKTTLAFLIETVILAKMSKYIIVKSKRIRGAPGGSVG